MTANVRTVRVSVWMPGGCGGRVRVLTDDVRTWIRRVPR